jgi:hypothetical protein
MLSIPKFNRYYMCSSLMNLIFDLGPNYAMGKTLYSLIRDLKSNLAEWQSLTE